MMKNEYMMTIIILTSVNFIMTFAIWFLNKQALDIHKSIRKTLEDKF